jgi:hypothetical protein
LTAHGADPLSSDFTAQVRQRPAIRRIVREAVLAWYHGLTGDAVERVSRQSAAVLAHTFRQLAGSRPVYYLWASDESGWGLIDRGQAQS